MLALRKAADRFHTKIDWLDSWHTFSFGEHHDPRFMGFGPLRVINEDTVKGGGGFPTHPHRDMEIVTVVLEGALSHKDSIGTGSTIRPGDVQKMSAGTGIRHSEFNASPTEPVHLLQIWIVPDREGVAPEYQQIRFAPEQRRDRLCLIAAPKGTNDVITLYQDARIYAADLSGGKPLAYEPAKDRDVWVQVMKGSLGVNGQALAQGDGLAAREEKKLEFTSPKGASLLLFDLGD